MQSAEYPSITSTGLPHFNTISTTKSGTPNSDFSSTNNALPSPPTPEQRKASHGAPHALNPRSCVTCRRRKVKCDKQIPCSNCTKAGTECVFPAPGRAPRKPRQGGKVVSEREAELLKRLRRLEGVVEELSGQVELEAIKHSPSSENSSAAAQQRDGDATDQSGVKGRNVRVVGMDEGTRRGWLQKNFRIGLGPPKTEFNVDKVTLGMGKLVVDEGRSHYVASPFWASITEEVEEIKGMLEEQEFESDSDGPVQPSDIITEPDHQSFLMGYSSSEVSLKPLHPLPGQLPFYWQTFLENVHPLTMLMHAPTMSKTIKDVRANLDNLRPSTEALMFSIYYATIISMSGEEVRTNLGVDKEILLKQYRFGTEQALSKARFLNTNEIVTLQAFVLFLVCVRRHDDTLFVWSLTGLALRMSQSLGLHRDGSRLGLSPFDTEMRRRLWWQIVILDLRAAEDHGSDPSIMNCTYDTEYPLNINDEDMNPEDEKCPVVREGATEMTFSLIRCEICSLLKKLTSPPQGSYHQRGPPTLTLEEKEALVREASLRLEDKYLKYCEDAGPLFWVAATVARLILAKMNLLLYHPLTQPGAASSLSQDLRDRLFMSAIEIIEYCRVLDDEATTKHWGWLFHTYIQWHAIAYILGELAVRENSITVERAWRAMQGVFNPWGGGDTVFQKNGMLWQPMRKLMARARKKREENKLKGQGGGDLGIDARYNISQPRTYTGYEASKSEKFPNASNFGTVNGNPGIRSETMDPSTRMYPTTAQTSMIEPQVIGMGMLAPEQIQMQLQQQQQSFIDDAYLEIDMNSLEGADMNWEGWDEMVRDFQLQAEGNARDADMGRMPTMGGMGNWW